MAILLQLKNLQVDNIDFDENMGFRNIKTTCFTLFNEG